MDRWIRYGSLLVHLYRKNGILKGAYSYGKDQWHQQHFAEMGIVYPRYIHKQPRSSYEENEDRGSLEELSQNENGIGRYEY